MARSKKKKTYSRPKGIVIAQKSEDKGQCVYRVKTYSSENDEIEVCADCFNVISGMLLFFLGEELINAFSTWVYVIKLKQLVKVEPKDAGPLFPENWGKVF
jgi:hypothetical protein